MTAKIGKGDLWSTKAENKVFIINTGGLLALECIIHPVT
jgi:hypothetical protein